MKRLDVLQRIKGGLIVSCQALKTEPLYSSYIMARLAYAAKEGGAVGIRANTPEDILEIKKSVDLPIIGLYKMEYGDSDVYITPTMSEIDALMEVKPDIIALDATNRIRPNGETIETFFKKVREKYPDMIFMADCSTYEEGIRAEELGMDIPSFSMIERLAKDLTIPLVAEGGIWAPNQLHQVFECGAYAAVVGTAITRPREITKRFVLAI